MEASICSSRDWIVIKNFKRECYEANLVRWDEYKDEVRRIERTWVAERRWLSRRVLVGEITAISPWGLSAWTLIVGESLSSFFLSPPTYFFSHVSRVFFSSKPNHVPLTSSWNILSFSSLCLFSHALFHPGFGTPSSFFLHVCFLLYPPNPLFAVTTFNARAHTPVGYNTQMQPSDCSRCHFGIHRGVTQNEMSSWISNESHG